MRHRSLPHRGDLPKLGRKLNLDPVYTTKLGALFRGDCMNVLPALRDGCVDTVFADPPFNIGKEYGGKVDDRREESEYLNWCNLWINECIRLLRTGGSLFLYNIPKWNVRLANYLLGKGMHFRDWIVVDIKFGLPIPGRLYPSHYSLLYFTKGKHKTFRNIRTPIRICRHCGRDIKDYGGYRKAMNPRGVNLTDVWDDIAPVRHLKFKSAKRKANALSTKILERVIEMSTKPGEMVLDPFGGSGTTYAVCEKKKRRWIGIEIESTNVIIDRLKSEELHHHTNGDIIDG
jgi:site-specific DNA-methyltransferase (adenine-specific)